MNQSARVTNLRTEQGQHLVDVVTSDGRAFTLAIDAGTRLPARVVTAANNVNLGDVLITTTFADYQTVDGVQSAARLITSTDDFVTSDVAYQDTGDQRGGGELSGPAGSCVGADCPLRARECDSRSKLSPGVWLLAGGSHHSALVEFSDHLLLIDAPQNDARAQAVIAKARELRPGETVDARREQPSPFRSLGRHPGRGRRGAYGHYS